MTILDQYITSVPSNQNALDIFKGEWSSKMPANLGLESSGSAALFDDPRVKWALAELGGARDKAVLELGPLEGAHTYLLEQAGAKSVLAIEANSRAYLKCLVVKEIMEFKHSRFLCGDFVEYLLQDPSHFDMCFASGVLYHMRNPVELLALAAKVSDQIFIWTHYYNQAIISANPVISPKFTEAVPSEYAGFKHILYRYEYQTALEWNGFCGGSAEFSYWLSQEDILSCLRFFGFTEIKIKSDPPQISEMHPNGPAFTLVASKTNNRYRD